MIFFSDITVRRVLPGEVLISRNEPHLVRFSIRIFERAFQRRQALLASVHVYDLVGLKREEFQNTISDDQNLDSFRWV